MIAAKTKTQLNKKRVLDAVDKAAYRSFGHAGGSIRKQAIASIESNVAGPGPAGRPYRTRRGLARRAIRYAATKTDVVIGPTEDKIGQAMAPHEHGLRRGKVLYPKRPTMALALKSQLSRVAGAWKNSL